MPAIEGETPRHVGPRCWKGYGHSLHTVLGTHGFDGLRGAGIRPLAAFLLLVAHGDFDTREHFGREDRSDAAQAEGEGEQGQGAEPLQL